VCYVRDVRVCVCVRALVFGCQRTERETEREQCACVCMRVHVCVCIYTRKDGVSIFLCMRVCVCM